MKTINDLYKYAADNNLALLSEYDAEWWEDYVTNSADYDKVFRRLYYSFMYFMQSKDETIAEVTENFIEDVANILQVHAKEFEQLYRVNELEKNAYGLTDNYDMREVMAKTTGDTIGSRSDSQTIGAQTSGTTSKVAPYDSETFYNNNDVDVSTGARSDSQTYGSQTNSGSENYTLTRKGNIGVMTSSDVIQKHIGLWESFNFYHYVFGVIAKELLTVGGVYDDDYDR